MAKVKKTYSVEELQKKRVELSQQRERLFPQYEKLGKKISRLYDRIRKIDEHLDSVKAEAKGVDWKWLLQALPDTTAKYRELEKQLSKIGLRSSGYFREINQTQISIAISKKDLESLKKVYKGLKVVLPFIKPLQDGYKHIDIFEHSLSSHGSWYLLIGKGEFAVAKDYYCSTRENRKFRTLVEALEYVREHLWYDA